MGSACEVEYGCLLAGALEFLQTEEYEHLTWEAVEIKRMLAELISKLRADRGKLMAKANNLLPPCHSC
jgi:four helix bundle protein